MSHLHFIAKGENSMSIKERIKVNAGKLGIVCVLCLIGIGVSSAGWSAEKKPEIKDQFFWGNYQEPFTEGILIIQAWGFKAKSPKLEVELPQDLAETTLILYVQSFVKGAFQYVKPAITIEGASKKKKYTIPVKTEPAKQQVEMTMKNLSAGKNIFSFSFDWRDSNIECRGEGCGYGVATIYFKDFPPSSKPAATPKAEQRPQQQVSEVVWSDYQKPLSLNVQIKQNRCAPPDIANINVDLPADFLKNIEQRTLTLELESNSSDSKGKELGFDLLNVYLSVNGVKYNISVENYPAKQTQQIKIASKHLRSGQNVLQASFEWKEKDWCCNSYGCGYTIQKLSFK